MEPALAPGQCSTGTADHVCTGTNSIIGERIAKAVLHCARYGLAWAVNHGGCKLHRVERDRQEWCCIWVWAARPSHFVSRRPVKDSSGLAHFPKCLGGEYPVLSYFVWLGVLLPILWVSEPHQGFGGRQVVQALAQNILPNAAPSIGAPAGQREEPAFRQDCGPA